MPIRAIILILALSLPAGCASRKGVYHTVREGQTLYRISQTYGVDPTGLARVNGVSDPTRLRVGQRLYIPQAARVRTVPKTVTGAEPESSASKSQTKTQPRSVSSSETFPPAKSKPTPPPKSPTKGLFAYPVKGKIVKHFGERAGNLNRGVEFAVPRGTTVTAAADGHVIYSGNGIKGYGHLIIIKHRDSYYTVYGYNEQNLVANGVDVIRGQRIALSGVPPSGGQARLHFEIRIGKEAVNPIFYLP
jgi:lipoprotein NlpD